MTATATAARTATILDKFRRPLRDLRISVTDRCNFRCSYCMPAEIFGDRYQFLPKNDLLTFEEIARITRILAELGVVKARLTGGEPLVRSEIEKLVAQLAPIEGIADLTMTTNAYLLPQKAAALRNAGLQRLTVSLDTLDDGNLSQDERARVRSSARLGRHRRRRGCGLSPYQGQLGCAEGRQRPYHR